ncbi:uncharacterized protein LOC105834898 isoform X1 [Monomorium pharaonis]|uniref:uncharacterized protein LOC118644739 isoform X1 n=1 Tax=Monomorium pharaonis TaxID=307658 RepID=UPI001746F612|nr:uncharacterized protein LOC118644739 isoform X1 [Monomorium pharaonis]XP_036144919.1 uncharacterized protein LOC118646344 isoform X1 [Monomorium pharaonis]XP_036149345.1 uncharacterized protein LOC118647825 isoform X1 [Monomorium pharaonis]XP_036150917.1 uncharacterized protein LOC105834898 isoform X1 [Monomorium pharaonis]
MNRKRQRKDISCMSKRHLNRITKLESDLICDVLFNTTSHENSHINIHEKFTKSTENVFRMNCDIEIENIGNTNNDTVNENINNDNVNDNNNASVEDINIEICRQSNNYIFESEESVLSEKSRFNLSNDSDATDNSFTDDLAMWAVKYQIPHTALKALLQRLRMHSCFSTLSLDARTLLKTPRKQELRIVPPGSYYHFGVLNSVSKILASVKDNIDCVKISVNIDGLPLSKSSLQQFWPILGSINPYNNVFVIGIYYGNEKPANANDFLMQFVDEVTDMCENGIDFNNRNIPCRLETLICDTPAKSFVLCVKGHSGYSSCTKCVTEGEYLGNRICFPQVDAPLRTDDDFIKKTDDNYHKPNMTCSLLKVPHFKPVTNVPLDYMHLICLGIMRKLIYLWLAGDLKYRLQSRAVEIISTNLVSQLKPYIPVEFARKPRKLDCVKLWKATEYRLILLYTGPLAFKSVLKKNVYINFLILHVIVRILSSQELNEYVTYAHELILFFIQTYKKLYGIYNMSHNVHSLVHLVDDVKKFGPIDNFSAFKFENYMQILKKYIRKSDKPLQQVVRRYIEQDINSDLSLSSIISSESVLRHPKLIKLHFDGPLIDNTSNPQYKIVKYNGITLKAGSLADNCCGLKCGAIVCIQNIAYCTKRNIPVIIGHEFLEKKEAYDIPCPSSLLGIYVVHSCSILKSWPLQHVIRKYVKLPCGDEKFAAFPLMHTAI